MSAWNLDIKAAPHGRYVVQQRRAGVDMRVFVPERVILTTKCGKVVLSHYIPDKKRWMMLGDGEQPVAWQAWPEPYPVSARGLNVTESAGGIDTPPSISPAAISHSLPPQMLSQQAANWPDAPPTHPASGQPISSVEG